MKSVKEILQKSKDKKMRITDYCFDWFMEHGYIYNEVIGWELERIFKRFKLNPNMKGIPTHLVEEINHKETKIPKKDQFGQKTGEYEIIREQIKTGKMISVPTPNFMEYYQWKKNKDEQAMAQGLNTPPLDSESQA